MRIQAGQWCALRRDVPFEIDTLGHSRQLAIAVPCAILPSARRGLDWWRQPRSFLRGPAQILHASASACVMTGSSFSECEHEQLGQQLAALIEMTVRADEAGPAIDVREGRRRAIFEHIDRNLADPELGIGSIARAFSISSRTIHKLFEGEAQTAARLIWDRRLERCREEMADPAMASRSITEIAHLWGLFGQPAFQPGLQAALRRDAARLSQSVCHALSLCARSQHGARVANFVTAGGGKTRPWGKAGDSQSNT